MENVYGTDSEYPDQLIGFGGRGVEIWHGGSWAGD